MEKKIIIATIDKISGTNTARIFMTRSVIHPIYKKRYTLTSRRLVDTTGIEVKVGDSVAIEPTKPQSKLKSWRVASIINQSLIPTKAKVAPKSTKTKAITSAKKSISAKRSKASAK